MIRSTPHAHTTYVDGLSSAEQMVESAIARGFSSIGFSEHGVQSFDAKYSLNEDSERAYIAEIARLRDAYAGRIAIYLGCERDAFSTADRSMYEYVIGSVHYLSLNGDLVAVDGPPDRVAALVRDGFGGDGIRFARAYYRALADYISSYRPEIVGHFDLIRKHNAGGALFDPADPRYEAAALEALGAMIPSGAMLEINTGAIARGAQRDPYPELRFLAHWRALGGRAILSSDCHDAAAIDCGYDCALALAREAGFRELWALNPDRSGPLFASYPLTSMSF